MYRIFKAPEREPGLTVLQADRGTWEALTRELLAAGDRELTRPLAAALGIDPAAIGRSGDVPAGDGTEVLRITLPTDQARRVLHAAGLDA